LISEPRPLVKALLAPKAGSSTLPLWLRAGQRAAKEVTLFLLKHIARKCRFRSQAAGSDSVYAIPCSRHYRTCRLFMTSSLSMTASVYGFGPAGSAAAGATPNTSVLTGVRQASAA
jgi:hypothetical protein